jgi:hypothetical protein
MKTKWPLAAGVVVLGAAALALAALAVLRLEGEKPALALEGVSGPLYLGKSAEFTVKASDTGSGLRQIAVTLQKDGREIPLARREVEAGGLLGLPAATAEAVAVRIDPAALGLSDGQALLRLQASDRSWRNWWHGTLAAVEHEVFIDTKPPAIEVLSKEHYVNQGGTGLVVYRLSEACPRSGVRVGARFYPGAAGYFADRGLHLAFFALSHQDGPGTEVALEAVDRAGNAGRGRFAVHIKKKVFKKDTLAITDAFIRQILPEFAADSPAPPNASLKEQFLAVNRDLRRKNYETLAAVTQRSASEMLWQGAFLRLPNAAPRAGFADHRVYLYEGREIDQQDHLGVDLASLARSPVPAANAGIVVFAERLGIYGLTVLLDHGFGLFSMYSHLSEIAVAVGERIARGHILGATGATGLAGGDHLHFGVMVHQTFVDPIEWWDPAWIKNTIAAKLEAVKSGS